MANPERTERNREIYLSNKDGLSYKKLSRLYGLTKGRIGQIVRAEEKKEKEESYPHL